MFVGAFILTAAMDYFVLSTGKDGLFPPGLGAIAKQIAFIFPGLTTTISEDSLYYFVYFILNIPLDYLLGLSRLAGASPC